MNILSSCKLTRVSNAAAAAQTAVNCTALDMSGFDSVVFIASYGTLSASAVPAIKVQQDTDSGMGSAADLAGTAVAAVETDDNKCVAVEVINPTERYVRAVITRGGGDAVLDGVIALQYRAHREPTTHDSGTVIGAEIHGPGTAEGSA